MTIGWDDKIISILVESFFIVLILSLLMKTRWFKKRITFREEAAVTAAETKASLQKKYRWFWFFVFLTFILIGFEQGHVFDKRTNDPRPAGLEVTVTSENVDFIDPEKIAWTPELLKAYESNIVELLKKKIRDSHPFPWKQKQLFEGIMASSEYMERDDKTLIVVRLKHATEKVTSAFVTGVLASKVTTVSCTDDSSLVDISFEKGACADKIGEIFGISLNKSSGIQ